MNDPHQPSETTPPAANAPVELGLAAAPLEQDWTLLEARIKREEASLHRCEAMLIAKKTRLSQLKRVRDLMPGRYLRIRTFENCLRTARVVRVECRSDNPGVAVIVADGSDELTCSPFDLDF